MHITFGWGYDGARWSESDSLRRYTTGPAGFTSLCATRLGLTTPAVSHVQRIAAYRGVLERHVATADDGENRPWFAQSFAKDPWATARQVLAWRDELVGAGWDGTEDKATSMLPRLRTLAQIEASLAQEPHWFAGSADLLRDVVAELDWLVSMRVPFDLGLQSIVVEHDRATLPQIWQRILDRLAELGVEVSESSQPAPLRQLSILEADSGWEAAAMATRAVRAHADNPFTLIAGRSTQLLDAELARYGLPTAGVREPGRARPGVQVVAVFMAAAMSPHDVHALANLLDMPLAVQQGDDGIRRQIRMLPGAVRRPLLEALAEQPGVGGSAWFGALEDIRGLENARHAELVEEFDQIIRINPIVVDAAGLETSQVIEPLTWLVKRLNALRRGLGSTSQTQGLDLAATHATTVIEVLSTIGSRVSLQEVLAIMNDAAGEVGPVVDSQRQTASDVMDVVTSPSRLGAGAAPVVWWLPFDDSPVQRSYSRAAEVEYLRSVGVEIADPEAIAALHLDSQIRAARQRGSVTAVLSATTGDGEPLGPHPLLTFLLDDVRSQYPDQSLEDVTEDVTCTVDEAFPAETVVPTAVQLTTRNCVRWELTPGEQLIPSRVSYSQWEKLLTHPADWLLERQLQIKAAVRTYIPTDNRMVGLWMHATVETLVNRYVEESGQPVSMHVTADDVRSTLLELMPYHASELMLPGYRRKRATLLERGTRAIRGLFDALGQTGTRITGVERRIDCEVPGTVGQDGKPLQLSGFRDVDIIMPDGRAGLIDMKYTNYKKRYADQIRTGQAMQLVVYAHSIRATHSGEDRGLAHIPTAYLMLKDGDMATEFNGFGAREVITLEPSEYGAQSADELWQRAVTGMNAFFDRLREGVLFDFGKLVERDEWKAYERALKKGDNAKVPRDGELYGPLQTARIDGFIPERSYRNRTYDLIAGVKEL